MSCTDANNGCSANVTVSQCSGSGTHAGDCQENHSNLNYQCYINTPTDPGGGGSDPSDPIACAWCAGADQCSASGGSYSSSNGYCESGLGCCAVSGGGDSGGGETAADTCDRCGDRKCGQAKSGGGTCGTEHLQAPPRPSNIFDNNKIFTVSAASPQVSLDWSYSGNHTCNRALAQKYEMFLQQTDGNGVILAEVAHISAAKSDSRFNSHGDDNDDFTYKFTPAGRYYHWRIRSDNTICGGDSYSSWVERDFQVYTSVAGTIYLDPNADAAAVNGKCVSPTVPAGAKFTTQRTQAPFTGLASFNTLGWIFNTSWPQVTGTDHDGSNDDTVKKSTDFGANNKKQIAGLVVSFKNDATHSPGGPGVHADNSSVSSTAVTSGGTVTSTLGPRDSAQTWDFTTSKWSGGDENRQRSVNNYKWYVNPTPLSVLRGFDANHVDASHTYWDNQGRFTAIVPNGEPTTLTLQLGAAGVGCTCPAGCTYDISTYQTGMNFYLSQSFSPWFQVQDGGVAAYSNSGSAIVDNIPSTCSGTCSPYLITTPNSNAPTVITGGGAIATSEGGGVHIDDENANRSAKLNSTPSQQNFAYFHKIFKMVTNPTDDFSTNADNATKPTAAPSNEGTTAYYHEGDLTITSPWQVNSGEKYTIFVNGNVMIAANVKVAKGGFLAIISSGNISVDSSVGNTSSADATPTVEGVYVADGQVAILASSKRFVGAGTFVGWTGFDFERDFGSSDNNSIPTELFIYRPDFLLNAPDEMKTPKYDWQEINP